MADHPLIYSSPFVTTSASEFSMYFYYPYSLILAAYPLYIFLIRKWNPTPKLVLLTDWLIPFILFFTLNLFPTKLPIREWLLLTRFSPELYPLIKSAISDLYTFRFDLISTTALAVVLDSFRNHHAAKIYNVPLLGFYCIGLLYNFPSLATVVILDVVTKYWPEEPMRQLSLAWWLEHGLFWVPLIGPVGNLRRWAVEGWEGVRRKWTEIDKAGGQRRYERRLKEQRERGGDEGQEVGYQKPLNEHKPKPRKLKTVHLRMPTPRTRYGDPVKQMPVDELVEATGASARQREPEPITTWKRSHKRKPARRVFKDIEEKDGDDGPYPCNNGLPARIMKGEIKLLNGQWIDTRPGKLAKKRSRPSMN